MSVTPAPCLLSPVDFSLLPQPTMAALRMAFLLSLPKQSSPFHEHYRGVFYTKALLEAQE